MTAEETLRELIAAWEANDALRAGAFFATDATYVEAGREALVGRERICEHFTRFFRDGPVWRFAVDEIVAAGERAAVAYTFGIRGDGGVWHERAGCAWVRLRDGLIERWREYHG